MATGGLGGVHRDAATTFDVSTDLDELARADGALVVCSGVKSILDLPATLEVLETRGVPIVGYRTDEFPAFTTRSSGLPLEVRAESPGRAAALVRAHRSLGLPGAVVLAQPVPEPDALDRDAMEAALKAALDEARARQITGKAVTPFLLDRVRQATEGREPPRQPRPDRRQRPAGRRGGGRPPVSRPAAGASPSAATEHPAACRSGTS